MSDRKSILLKIPEELKKELENEAKAKDLPLTRYITMLLLERNK